MSEQNGTSSSVKVDETPASATSPMDKGKGKAVEPQDLSMEEDESEEEESAGEEHAADELEGEDEDGMDEIDTDNIISDGRRTRGKTIDFAKAAAEAGDEDEDEEDDEDFIEEDADEMKD